MCLCALQSEAPTIADWKQTGSAHILTCIGTATIEHRWWACMKSALKTRRDRFTQNIGIGHAKRHDDDSLLSSSRSLVCARAPYKSKVTTRFGTYFSDFGRNVETLNGSTVANGNTHTHTDTHLRIESHTHIRKWSQIVLGIYGNKSEHWIVLETDFEGEQKGNVNISGGAPIIQT